MHTLPKCVNRHTLASMPRRRVSFFLDEHLAEGLKQLKARHGTPEAEAIRRAIAEYLEGVGITSEKQADRKRAVTRKRS